MLTKSCSRIISSKTVPHTVWLLLLCLLLPGKMLAQNTKNADSSKIIINTNGDTSKIGNDTIAKNNTDTLEIPTSPSALTSEVKYSAKDSIVYDIAAKKVYLYGTAHIDYQTISLDADSISIDWNTNEISAGGRKDSSGKVAGLPKFKDGEQEFRTKTLKYNFKTKAGRIDELRTQEGTEGFIHTDKAKTIKENGKDVIFAKDAKYTTCNLDDPHFYIQTNKLKLLPKDKVITGPAMIYVEKVPIPLVLPFGFFPANSRKSSGIIIPAVGNGGTRGFMLRNGGFYYGGSDYFDAALVGDIYTGGSYNASIETNYAKRYRFNGNIAVRKSWLEEGLRETPSHAIRKDFRVNWRHSQNPKARPGTSFSADVNIGTGGYSRNTSFNPTTIFEQTMQSSVSYGKSFRVLNTPFNLTSALTHSQNVTSGAIDFTLPSITLSMSRIYPFKGKNAIEKKWYHDIGITYNLDVRNQISTSDSTIRADFNNRDKFLNGGHQSVPFSTSFKVLKYFTLSPQISYDGFFYTKKTIKEWDDVNDTLLTRIENGFYQAHTWGTSANLTTQLYGMYKINRGRILALRHQLTPSLNANYRPNYSAPGYGYYSRVQVSEDSITKIPAYQEYSVFAGSVVGAPGSGRQGSLGFSVTNNFEMKVRAKNDTAGTTKKIKLLESLGISGNYNFLADSLKLSHIAFSAFTTLFDKVNVNASAVLDPYQFDTAVNGREYRVNRLMYENKKTLGRITDASIAFSTSFNEVAQKEAARVATYSNPFLGYYYANQPYASFDIPWDINISYNLRFSKPGFKETFTQFAKLEGHFNITPKWKLNARSDFDIKEAEVTFAQFTILRDLHCWEMSFEWTPFGPYKSYFFNIHIKASTLRDLKLEKQRRNYQFE